MECQHKEIIIANAPGEELPSGGVEVNLVVRCDVCSEGLFRISEHRTNITNISKH